MFTPKTDLPQYMFGDGINQDDTLARNDSTVGMSSIVEDFHISEPNLSRIPSPASSLASTRKLEWDSGADIGYNLYSSLKYSRRSKSFPSLNMDLSISQINKSDETQDDEISMENKVTSDVFQEISNINSQSTSQSVTQNNRKSAFKHSTPCEEKMASKIIEKSKTKISNKNDECLQTTLVHTCSKSVQTDENFLKDVEKVNETQTDILKSQSSSSGSSLSKSSSFQYIPGSKKSTAENTESTKTDDSHRTGSRQSRIESIKSESAKSSSIISSSKSLSAESSGSNNSPLGKLIATQQSKHLIVDIDKSLHILQRFINSKNYTIDTKRFYTKKIVNKILSSKYEEDSSASSSKVTLSNKSNEEPIEPNIKNNSNDNKDVNDFILKEKISSKKVNCGIQCDSLEKDESKETNKTQKITEKLGEIIYKNNKFTEECKHKTKSDSSLDLLNKNWRNEETLSEKLFEARKKSLHSSHSSNNSSKETVNVTKKSEYLIQHSKNEKKRQLSWISNEISYLHKLKELLQKNDSSSNASITFPKPLSKSQQSTSSNEIISSAMSDIEIKFYEEFGSSDLSKITGNMENLKKLSKCLTNDQLKFLIENDSKKMYCKTCECCVQKSLNTKLAETHKNKNSLQTFVSPLNSHRHSHDMDGSSFNSHNNKFYENLIKSSDYCNPRRIDHNIKKNQTAKKSDAGIQCTLKKKKHYPSYQRDDTSYSASPEYSSNDKTNVKVHYRNTSSFDYSDSQSTVNERSEPEIVPKIKEAPKCEKENYCQIRHVKCRPIPKQIKPAEAYFLTFEEDSECVQSNLRKNMLEEVTVKVPKLSEPVNKNKTKGSYQKNTLYDYLKENRPDFVKAADFRRSVISDQSARKPRNIFTCTQMKELTSKKYSKLPEVQNKLHTCKLNKEKRQNRNLANLFSKKLQKKTLKGQVSLATCRCVMLSD